MDASLEKGRRGMKGRHGGLVEPGPVQYSAMHYETYWFDDLAVWRENRVPEARCDTIRCRSFLIFHRALLRAAGSTICKAPR